MLEKSGTKTGERRKSCKAYREKRTTAAEGGSKNPKTSFLYIGLRKQAVKNGLFKFQSRFWALSWIIQNNNNNNNKIVLLIFIFIFLKYMFLYIYKFINLIFEDT